MMRRSGASSWWLSCYVATGTALLANVVRESYTRAANVCEMYPQFAFGETFREELWDHTTWLPVVHTPIGTLLLVLLYALAYVVLRFNLVEAAWLLLTELLSGKWILYVLFELLPAYLPFLAAEPGVPDLLSDGDDDADTAFEAEFGIDGVPRVRVNATECNRAIQKLVEVKLQYANTSIERPDDWLVFDPVEGLVPLHKNKTSSKRREEYVKETNESNSAGPDATEQGFDPPALDATTQNGALGQDATDGLRQR
uniref:Uncharacterized protein n=1 Tax=Globisporangium ultimum (strain ATCC 200006 / CBS 805.95 / DAOM BR144) TaxID=431595 RepID=K3XBA3_GLOUD